MLSLLNFNLILCGLLFLAIGFTLYTAYLNYRRHRLNIQIASDLDVVLKSTMTLVKKNEKMAMRDQINNLYQASPKTQDTVKDLESPQMLSRILTVIIKKYGDLHLVLKDFTNIVEEDYVSVYVDSTSKELILSMNHELSAEDKITMANFNPPDDNTFH